MASRSPLLMLLILAVALMPSSADRDPMNRNPRDPLKKRVARNGEDTEAKLELYRQRFKDDKRCVQHPVPPNAPTMPSVPSSFITELEITFQEPDQQFVIYGTEMYSHLDERGVLDYYFNDGILADRPFLLSELIHYNIRMDEALFILTNEGCAVTGLDNCDSNTECLAGKIDDLNKEIQQLFGIVSVSGDQGFMGAAGLLMFGSQFNYSAREEIEVCHGLDCYVFETCLNNPEEESSVLYTYYWSTEDWNLHNNGEQVPIAVDIFATGKYNGATVKEVLMRYDFFNFRRDWAPSRDELEPPAHVYCADRKTYLDPPKTATSFSYKAEIVTTVEVSYPDGDNQTVPIKFSGLFPMKMWYDWKMRITKQEFNPLSQINNTRSFENYTSVVHDFNQGLAYVMMTRQNYCKITPIQNRTSWGDVRVDADGSVYMQSPWNFEELDEAMQYNGAHWERGLEADVWVGIKKNLLLKVNETYVWYFASPLTYDKLGAAPGAPLPVIPTVDKVPIKMEKYFTQLEDQLPHVTHNFYGFDSDVPTTHTHDIATCYSPDQMRHFQFDMPSNSLKLVSNRRENLKYALMESLSNVGKVTPLRINRIELEETAAALQVVFTLLEKPTVQGDAKFPLDENTMDEAAMEIQKTIDDSQLVVSVEVPNKVKPVTLVVLHGTMKEVERDDGHTRGTNTLTGYSPGDMAGLAIGMLILGGIVGYIGIGIYSSRK
ncbi:uncharacterized protein [Procambarus clarkii]|uniref:uncharacterized protein n=1 Tax=Procambarus clarkii TaxID=6728 RepID=UPI001E67649D|nr:uncharacterized protein LOC123759965 [Procambarus clarkii]XP_045601176.1 uncharacterized protein LOC123759965 [Procambarus clarkii]